MLRLSHRYVGAVVRTTHHRAAKPSTPHDAVPTIPHVARYLRTPGSLGATTVVGRVPFHAVTPTERRPVEPSRSVATPPRRSFGTTPPPTPPPLEETTTVPSIGYEAPFASLALRLKRVSISSAVLSLVGVPLLVFFQGGGGNVPASGQLAVGGTAVLAACGSTAALSYCFSPYVHSLEWITVRCPTCIPTAEDGGGGGGDGGDGDGGGGCETPAPGSTEENLLIKATTRNIFALPVETIFDPQTDVVYEGVAKKTNRPFCNFIAKGVPLYVHPELVRDVKLRALLVGTAAGVVKSPAVGEDGTDGGGGDDGGGGTFEGDVGVPKKKEEGKGL